MGRLSGRPHDDRSHGGFSLADASPGFAVLGGVRVAQWAYLLATATTVPKGSGGVADVSIHPARYGERDVAHLFVIFTRSPVYR